MADNNQLEFLVNKLVSATDPEEVKAAYAQWAKSYESDLHEFGYVAPSVGIRLLVERVLDKSSLIHDAGCGTGLVGKLLSEVGFSNLHGTDFSPEMLQKAQATGHYQKLDQVDFGGPLRIHQTI